MTFNPITNPVDYVMLAGKRTPGIATLAGWPDHRNWDERRGYGFSGATLIYKGAPLIRGKIHLYLFESEHFDEWETFRQILKRPTPPTQQQLDRGIARPRATVLDCVHPQLAQINVRRVTVEEVGILEPEGEDGGWGVDISLIEFHPPERSLHRPIASRQAQEQMDARDFILLNQSTQIEALANEVPQ